MATIEEFRAYLDTLPPDQRQQFIDDLLADYPGQDARLKEQLDVAEELRGTPLPGMRRTRGMTHAANPLEFVGSALQQYRGQRLTKEADRERERTEGRRQNALRRLFNFRTARKPTPMPAGPAATGASPGALANALRARPYGGGRI